MTTTTRLFDTLPTFDDLCYRGRDLRTTGTVIRMDDGRTFVAKRTDEPRVDAGFAGCEWRLGLSLVELAINITTTGRTVQTWGDAGWIRVRIEYVGDCEPSTFVRAWARVW